MSKGDMVNGERLTPEGERERGKVTTWGSRWGRVSIAKVLTHVLPLTSTSRFAHLCRSRPRGSVREQAGKAGSVTRQRKASQSLRSAVEKKNLKAEFTMDLILPVAPKPNK